MTNLTAAARLSNFRGSCLGRTCPAPIDLFVNHSTTTSFAIGAPLRSRQITAPTRAPAPRRQRLLMIAIADRRAIALGPHSRGWTGGRVDALLGVEGATVGASVWLRGADGLSLTCELGPTTAALCASSVALDRLERAVNGLVR